MTSDYNFAHNYISEEKGTYSLATFNPTAPVALLGLRWFERATGLRASFPAGVTLGTVLGVMIAWRAFAKVVGLMGWWRPGRVKGEREDDDWAFLFASLGGAAAVATGGALADFATRWLVEADLG